MSTWTHLADTRPQGPEWVLLFDFDHYRQHRLDFYRLYQVMTMSNPDYVRGSYGSSEHSHWTRIPYPLPDPLVPGANPLWKPLSTAMHEVDWILLFNKRLHHAWGFPGLSVDVCCSITPLTPRALAEERRTGYTHWTEVPYPFPASSVTGPRWV